MRRDLSLTRGFASDGLVAELAQVRRLPGRALWALGALCGVLALACVTLAVREHSARAELACWRDYAEMDLTPPQDGCQPNRHGYAARLQSQWAHRRK